MPEKPGADPFFGDTTMKSGYSWEVTSQHHLQLTQIESLVGQPLEMGWAGPPKLEGNLLSSEMISRSKWLEDKSSNANCLEKLYGQYIQGLVGFKAKFCTCTAKPVHKTGKWIYNSYSYLQFGVQVETTSWSETPPPVFIPLFSPKVDHWTSFGERSMLLNHVKRSSGFFSPVLGIRRGVETHNQLEGAQPEPSNKMKCSFNPWEIYLRPGVSWITSTHRIPIHHHG